MQERVAEVVHRRCLTGRGGAAEPGDGLFGILFDALSRHAHEAELVHRAGVAGSRAALEQAGGFGRISLYALAVQIEKGQIARRFAAACFGRFS